MENKNTINSNRNRNLTDEDLNKKPNYIFTARDFHYSSNARKSIGLTEGGIDEMENKTHNCETCNCGKLCRLASELFDKKSFKGVITASQDGVQFRPEQNFTKFESDVKKAIEETQNVISTNEVDTVETDLENAWKQAEKEAKAYIAGREKE